MTDRELMQQALEALTCSGEDDDPGHRCTHCDDYVDRNGPLRAALQERLAQTEQEPLGWMVMNGVCDYQLLESKEQADALAAEMQKRYNLSGSLASFHVQPYPAPPRREWVSLTVDEIVDAKIESVISFRKHDARIRGQQFTAADDPYWHFARAIEAKLREKNGGQK
jgi:hypothetical protein